VAARNPQASRKLADLGQRARRQLSRVPAVQAITQGGMTVYALPQFLSAEECAVMIALIDAYPSTLYSGTEREGFRTSYSCDLPRANPLLAAVDARICAVLGMDPRHGESIQGQRYQPGQHFGSHHDYFHTHEDYWQQERVQGGQRSWTAMVFLNQPEGGGETNFGSAGICISPQTGLLLLWDNMVDDGSPNVRSLHEGCAVTAGTKYIITKWFRERFWVGNIPQA